MNVIQELDILRKITLEPFGRVESFGFISSCRSEGRTKQVEILTGRNKTEITSKKSTEYLRRTEKNATYIYLFVVLCQKFRRQITTSHYVGQEFGDICIKYCTRETKNNAYWTLARMWINERSDLSLLRHYKEIEKFTIPANMFENTQRSSK